MKYLQKVAKMPDFIAQNTYCHPQDCQIDNTSIGGFVLPGIIDMHFHGAMGWDFSFGNEEKINEMLDATGAAGITGVLATVLTSDSKQMDNILKAIKNVAKNRNIVPIIHGIYLEGPFLAYEQKGAHPAEFLMPPSIELLKKWQDEAEGLIKVITVAPELPGAIDFIKEATKMGVKIALGHSNADWQTTKNAIIAGASIVTHMFNAMPQIHHRKPNITSYALTNKNLQLEVIADCEHVSPEIINLITQTRDNEKIIFISDSMALTGLPEGQYNFYNQNLEKTKTRAKLQNGGFFGGAIMLPKSLHRLSTEAGISWGEIGESVWRNPCNFLNIQPPNIQVYFDTEMNWQATYHNGNWYIAA